MSQSNVTKQLDLRFLQLDLQDLKSVRAAALRFMTEESRLDILINNAGVGGLLSRKPRNVSSDTDYQCPIRS